MLTAIRLEDGTWITVGHKRDHGAREILAYRYLTFLVVVALAALGQPLSCIPQSPCVGLPHVQTPMAAILKAFSLFRKQGQGKYGTSPSPSISCVNEFVQVSRNATAS